MKLSFSKILFFIGIFVSLTNRLCLAQTNQDSLDVYYRAYEEAESGWFKEGKRFGAGLNLPFGLFGFYNLIGGGGAGNKLLVPPLSVTGIYHPKNSFSLDFNFHFESNRSYKNTSGYINGQRYHVGIRPLYFFPGTSRTKAYLGARLGYLFSSKMNQVLKGYDLNSSLFTRTKGLTFQLCLGMEQRLMRDASMRFELAMGNPYFFSLSFCYYVF